MTTCSTRPISPACTRSRKALNDGSKRRLKPTITTGSRPPISAQQASTLAMSRWIGFSQSTALPAFTARVSRSTWVSVEEAISTARTPGSASASSTEPATVAPSAAPTSSAAALATS
jgi:hypothetical protein